MRYSRDDLRGHAEDIAAELRRKSDLWERGAVTPDNLTIEHGSAREWGKIASCAALAGVVDQAREWFGEAARLHLEQIRTGRSCRDLRDRIDWEGEPRAFYHALNTGLLSRNEDLLTKIATEAITADEVYLDEFAEDYPDSPANFYDMKAHAALALDDDRATTYVAELRDAIEVTDDPSLYWETIPEFYAAVLDGSTADVEAALADLHDFFVSEAPNPDDPSEYVLDDVAAYVVLARRHDFDPSIESDRVPETLLREKIPADDPTLDIDVDSLQFTSSVGFFELERDDEGRPVIAGRIYHPGGEPVTADDVPEREAGRVLSDAWVEAALDEAEWREHYDDETVADARAAFEDGTLQRKLVVVQDRVDSHTFDESLAELPIDDVSMLKGAGRKR